MATYQKNEKITFVNPYTFVPLSEKDPERIDAEGFYSDNQENLQSGYLQCQLEVKTPLAIPNIEGVSYSEPTKKDEEKTDPNDKHASYPFLKLNGKPAVPGSSIRGAIRSVYETVTDSCMCTAKPETGISQRIDPDDCFEPGLLIRNYQDEWELYKAKTYSVQFEHKKEDKNNDYFKSKSKPIIFKRTVIKGEAQINGLRYGDSVYFDAKGGRVTELSSYQKRLKRSGYLFIGETFSEKKSERIFEKWRTVDINLAEITEALAGLEETVKVYQNKAINKNYDGKTHLGYPGLNRAKKEGVIPLWFKVSDGHLYFSMAAIGRKWFHKTYNELLGEYVPCTDRKFVCPACLLFGMISDHDKDHYSMGSRIRISDACFSGENADRYLTQGIVLKELASPKPSYLPFYSKGGVSYDHEGGGIRGRKYYRHYSAAEKNELSYRADETTKRNATMALMQSGAVFDFKIYFDQITQEQLDTLMAVVTLGKDTDYCHKLGHGKPLGLGSVKFKISQVVKRTYQDGQYQLNVQKDPDIEADLSRELKAVLAYSSDFGQTVPVVYPWVEVKKEIQKKFAEIEPNDLASHQWFNEFKKEKTKGKSCVLPEILASDPALWIYELTSLASPDSSGKKK